MSQGFGKGPITPRPKGITDHPLQKLHGELNNSGKRPSFHPYLHQNSNDSSKNAPRIVVYTNDDADKQMKQDQIQGELDLVAYLGFIQAIRDAANPNVEFKQEVVELRNYIWMNGQRSEEPKTKAYLIVGRNDTGTVYVSLKHFDPKRAALKFEFGYSVYVRMVAQEGQISPAVASRRVANSMATLWESSMIKEWQDKTGLPIPKQMNQQGGGFGGNKGGFGGQQQGGFGGQQQGGFGGQGGFGQQAKPAGGYAADDDVLMF